MNERYPIDAVLHESATVSVTRAQRLSDGRSVILKRLNPVSIGTTAEARLRREYELLAKLDLPGVIKVLGLEEDAGCPMLVLEDIGGTDLTRLLGDEGRLTLPEFLTLASGLAATLTELHREDIVHKDLNPSHIVYNRGNGQFRLIGFGIAATLSRQVVPPNPPAVLEGTLAYISPEQTGRTNRTVDHRTDFYALGATFYQLLTGRLPFVAEDELGLIHCHIAQAPVPPHEIETGIPLALSRIVTKLLAKNPEDRYQNGSGLKADLDRCLAAFTADGVIPDFPPGLDDHPERLPLPQRLYGRDSEVERLHASYRRIEAGGRELLLVAGYAGVGKTALVREAYRQLLDKRGSFIEGKFDPLRQGTPYTGWIMAFSGLIDSLLMEGDAELAQWRREILAAVGKNGRVLTEVIPKLELVIGPQPPAPPLGSVETRFRFNHLFLELVKALAGHHPLVLFLDDLQWIDTASLQLLQILVAAKDIGQVLVIGAYRENEVDALHPLTKAVEAMRAEGERIEVLTIGNLSEEMLNALAAATLQCAPEQTISLSRMIRAKTDGNPFFALQLLDSLVEEKILRYHAAQQCWQWDDAAVARLALADNVVALMLGRIANLPQATRQVLPLAAAIGFHFAVTELAVIARRSEQAVREDLRPALREGLLLASNGGCDFVHDRIRQAAYSLIPEADRPQLHLDIGRLLWQRFGEQGRDERLFAIVDHLNEGSALIADEAEKMALARLNFEVGRRSRASAAYAAAAQYLNQAIRLAPGFWQDDYPLALALHTEAAESDYLAGNHQSADGLIDVALAQARSAVDRATIHSIRVVIATTQNRLADAIAIGLRALGELGETLSDLGDAEGIRQGLARELERYHGNLRRTDLDALGEAPPMRDATAEACVGILMHLVLVSYYVDYPLFSLLTARMTNLSLERGETEASPLAYVLMSMVLISLEENYRESAELARCALSLHERRRNFALEGKLLMFYANCVAPWFHHVSEGLPVQRRAFTSALEAGSVNEALNCLWGQFRNLLFGGGTLDEAKKICQEGIAFADRIGDKIFGMGLVYSKHVILCFQGLLADPASLSSSEIDEEEFLATVKALGWKALIAHYLIFKTWTQSVYGHHDEALRLADECAGMVRFVGDQPHIALHYLHHSLLLLHRFAETPQEERQGILQKVDDNLAQLTRWAEHCPENFRHYALLVEAERARVDDHPLEAMDLYDQALLTAERYGAHYAVGVAAETAARFWNDRGKPEFAATYLRRARHAYVRWQAWGKVKALDDANPDLFGQHHHGGQGAQRVFDIESLMKATGAITGEVGLQRLLAAIVRIVIESAGAQSGYLLREREGGWFILAAGEIGRDTTAMTEPVTLEATAAISPAVVRYVARTQAPVVLDEACGDGMFAADPHIVRDLTRSLFCAPLLSRGKLIGILYLKNNLTGGVFSRERADLLGMLLAQVAVSLENAAIYEALRDSEERYRLVFENSPVSIWEEDLSAVKGFLDDLKDRGVTDIEGYFDQEPEAVQRCAGLIRIVDVNGAALSLHGATSKEELLSGLVNTFTPESLDTLRHELVSLWNGRTGIVCDGVVQTLAGERRNVTVYVSVCPGYEKTLSRVLVSLADITERKAAEDELHRLNTELDRRVLERTAQLEGANQELEAFAYSVSHDLRAPVRHIDGFLGLLRQSTAGSLDERSQHYIATVIDAAKRMGLLIDDLLAFSRMGRRELATAPVDLNALAREVIRDLEPDTAGRDIRWSIADLPVVTGDRAMLRVVFVNLIGNAVKFTRTRQSAEIDIGCLHADHTETTVYIRDNGVGFDMQYADKLFGVFQRLHGVDEFEGTGIGLANVRRIVSRHGGRTWAKGQVGQGAEFCFSLPASTRPLQRS